MRALLPLSLALAPALALAGPDLEPRLPLPKEPVEVPAHADPSMDLRLEVKFADRVRARARDDGRLDLLPGVDRAALDALVAGHDLRFEQLLDLSPQRLQALERRARERRGRHQPDLAGIVVVAAGGRDDHDLADLGNTLLDLEIVEYAYLSPSPVPPPGDIDPPTGDYTSRQGYAASDPGIDAHHAWDEGFTGTGIRLSDCEYGWVDTHEDLMDRDLGPEPGQTPDPFVAEAGYDEHGTAVLGETSAVDNGYGCTGLVPDALVGTYPEYTVEGGPRRSSAITSAVADSLPGDVVLLEMQVYGAGGNFGPAEYDPTVWTVTRTGVDAGVIVVAAAGNGAEDLDSEPWAPYRARGDSGAIIVGAGSADVGHGRLSFSTYGTRVDLQGWGGSVFTLGYGDFAELGGDDDQRYTAGFSGTSSASPIVASAAVIASEVGFYLTGDALDPEDIRELLVDTGTPQGSGGHIGPLPDLEAAIDQLFSTLYPGPEISEIQVGDAWEGSEVLFVGMGTVPEGGGTATWTWDFGSGEPQEGQSAAWTWEDDGVYPVRVSYLDEAGHGDVRTFDVTVGNLPPTIGEVSGASSADEGTTVDFEAVATDPGEDELEYWWDWGNGESSAGRALDRVGYAWPDEGVFDIALVVRDADGGEAEVDVGRVNIANVAPSIAEIVVPDEVRSKDPATLRIEASDPGRDALEYTWSFGDGSPYQGGEAPTHTWERLGTYTVSVEISDGDGGEDFAEVVVDVRGKGCGCAPVGAPAAAWPVLLGLVLWRRRRARG